MPITRSMNKQDNKLPDSSTPYNESNSKRPTGRPSIHENPQDQEVLYSPITSHGPDRSTETNSETDSDDDSTTLPNSSDALKSTTEENPSPKIKLPPKSTDTTNGFKNEYKSLILVLIGILCAVCAVATFTQHSSSGSDVDSKYSLTIEDLQRTFPLQSMVLWSAFKTGIDEVITLNKPSVFLLLYEDTSQETLKNLVHNISTYSICNLKADCSLKPLILSNKVLNSERALADYGNVIEEYKFEIESKGVVIVNNLEQIKGKVAQIFHSMCDEFSPLVSRAILIFTMKVEKFPELPKTDMQLVETILHQKWSDLNNDIFYPLITRITSMVLRIVPEK